jgi:hypothetical protein
MRKQQIFQAVKDMQVDKDIATTLNRIDYKITNIRLTAEKSLRSFKQNWWHKDLILWEKRSSAVQQEAKTA